MARKKQEIEYLTRNFSPPADYSDEIEHLPTKFTFILYQLSIINFSLLFSVHSGQLLRMASSRVCHFKLVLLGDSAVGKSCLVVRFVRDEFFEFQEPTIGGIRYHHCPFYYFYE